MSLNNAKPGAMSVGHYQISSIPWVTSSNITGKIARFELPRLSRFLTITLHTPDSKNTIPIDHQVALGFTSGGLDVTHTREHQNFFLINAGQTFTLPVRTDRFFLSASKGTAGVSICAGLTMIDTDMQPIMTGSLKGVYSGVG